ncbi:MAG: helix-turn-helix domain-containing protein [Alphaproteobacteria bacterium]|nr:helix-turn-helix domain-containing protein [Alphaproteobacteria bacterium]
MSGRKFGATDFEKRLGQIIAMQRTKMGMSQADLARAAGVTFQQIHNYESAENRIAAGTLHKIATAFEMTVGQLIDGATAPYMQDPHIAQTINLMYSKMTAPQRKCLCTVAAYMTGSN